jgi:hypothetical protein
LGTKKAGRPLKLTPQLQEAICKTLQAGVDVETACLREGVSRDAYFSWRRRGRDGEQPFADFLAATDKALADVETGVTYQILKASKTHWQAGAWWVKWRATRGAQRIEISGKDGAPISGALTHEAVDQIRKKILYGDNAANDAENAAAPSGGDDADERDA